MVAWFLFLVNCCKKSAAPPKAGRRANFITIGFVFDCKSLMLFC